MHLPPPLSEVPGNKKLSYCWDSSHYKCMIRWVIVVDQLSLTITLNVTLVKFHWAVNTWNSLRNCCVGWHAKLCQKRTCKISVVLKYCLWVSCTNSTKQKLKWNNRQSKLNGNCMLQSLLTYVTEMTAVWCWARPVSNSKVSRLVLIDSEKNALFMHSTRMWQTDRRTDGKVISVTDHVVDNWG